MMEGVNFAFGTASGWQGKNGDGFFENNSESGYGSQNGTGSGYGSMTGKGDAFGEGYGDINQYSQEYKIGFFNCSLDSLCGSG